MGIICPDMASEKIKSHYTTNTRGCGESFRILRGREKETMTHFLAGEKQLIPALVIFMYSWDGFLLGYVSVVPEAVKTLLQFN